MLYDYAMSAATSALKLQAARDFVSDVIDHLEDGTHVYAGDADYPNTLVVEGSPISRDPYIYFEDEDTYKRRRTGGRGHAEKSKIVCAVNIAWKNPTKPTDKELKDTRLFLAATLKSRRELHATLLHEYVHVMDFRTNKIHNVKTIYKDKEKLTGINKKYLASGWEMEAYGQNEFDKFFTFVEGTTIVFDTWKETRKTLFRQNEKVRAYLQSHKSWPADNSDKFKRSYMKRLVTIWPYVIYHVVRNKIEPMLANKDRVDDPVKFRADMLADKELQNIVKRVMLNRPMLDRDSIKDKGPIRSAINTVLRAIADSEKLLMNGKYPYYHAKAMLFNRTVEINLHPDNYNRVFVDPGTKNMDFHFKRPVTGKRSDKDFVIEQIKTPGTVLNTGLEKALS